jgi:ABC-type bacteriocin/lantibiotic exporter with double-glycine peptidase domain
MERLDKYLPKRSPDRDVCKARLPSVENICFKNVSVSIGQQVILDRISATFEKGKIYGIVGPSGSGKTSIVNLLCGLIQPTSGNIFVNNSMPLHEIENWSDFLSLVEKENQLFNGSIEDNIKYGNFTAAPEQIGQAGHLAMFRGVMEQLPNGLKTIITESGGFLSDGQKQRISIARGLLKKNSTIIFDEATAAIDTVTETAILKNIRSMLPSCITIIITHRSNCFPFFDTIYHLDNGHLSV